MPVVAIQRGEEQLSLAAVGLRAALDHGTDPLRWDLAEDRVTHPLGRDSGIEQDRPDGAKEAGPFGESLCLRGFDRDQFLVGVAEDAADQHVEHLDDIVRELFATHTEEGQQQGVAFGGRIAAQRLGRLAAHESRPLPAPI